MLGTASRNAKLITASALALAFSGAMSAAEAQEGATAPRREEAQSFEIVVTATRRAQSVLEVPYNISAVSGAELERAGVSDFVDVQRLTPGLIAPDFGVRANSTSNNFIIRGLNSARVDAGPAGFPPQQTSPVSTYVDETPIFTNLKLNDIARVEVLRGPQGTLYGSGAVGGTVRIIHNEPVDRLEFSGTVEGSKTEDAGDFNYGIDGVANIPLAPFAVLRVSAGYEEVAGFLDADRAVLFGADGLPALADPTDPLGSGPVFTRREDVDDSQVWFARSTLKLDLGERVEALLVYHHQSDEAGGFTAQTIGRDRVTETSIPEETFERDLNLYSATVTADLGFASVISSSSYYDIEQEDRIDFTGGLSGFLEYYSNYPRLTALLFDDIEENAFTQEVRLVSQHDGPWSWVVGGYYQKAERRAASPQIIPGLVGWSQLPGSGAVYSDAFGIGPFDTFDEASEYYNGLRLSDIPNQIVYDFNRTIETKDYALFGELSYQLTANWQVTGGVRSFWNENTQRLALFAPLLATFEFDAAGAPVPIRTAQTSEFDDQIFKFNTSYSLNDDTLLYLTVAQGYRAGGGNAIQTTGVDAVGPEFLSYDSDEAVNYEVGIKGVWADRLTYTLAGYVIDWKDVQVVSSTPFTGTPFIVNGETARSSGVELDLRLRVNDHLDLSLGYAYTNAELTEDFQVRNLSGRDGDRLPGVAEHQLGGAIDYRRPVANDLAFLARLDASYRSEIVTNLFRTNPNFNEVDGFSLANASIGMEKGRATLRLFVDNLFDDDAITTIQRNRNSDPSDWFEFLSRPRTVGLRLSYAR